MLIERVVKLISSLRLTVVLLALGLILVFLGTMAQEPLGLYVTQEKFFRSFFVDSAPMLAALKKSLQMAGVYLPPMSATEVLAAPRFPVFPGGYLVGTLLLANLVAAHITRFSLTWKKSGLFMIHIGVILLLVGQLGTDLLSTESHMRLTEGESKNYSESGRVTELVFITDSSDGSREEVVSIPEHTVAKQAEVRHPRLPFKVRVTRFMKNARIAQRAPMVDTDPPAATQGFGAQLKITEVAPATKMDERDLPAAVIELATAQGTVGSWLVSSQIDELQEVQLGGKSWRIGLRFMRYYKPFQIELVDFQHDLYMGTPIPKNFSSLVRLHSPETGEHREVKIWMNNPLRYGGETFYQSGYDENDPRVTILQVVRNPGWLTPYFACVIVGLGLLVQFAIHLAGFVNKRRPA